MTHSIQIAPSILSADFAKLKEEIDAIDSAGADRVHVDVMDGHFVPNLTLGPIVVSAIRRSTKLPLDVHLMIDKPHLYIDAFVDAGADILGVHVEASSDLGRDLKKIRKAGIRACATLNPETPASRIRPFIEELDQVLIMTVKPGFGGQRFMESCLPKIAEIRAWISDMDLVIDLAVDGGIGPETAGRASQAGANILIAGTAIFGSKNYRESIANLRDATSATPILKEDS